MRRPRLTIAGIVVLSAAAIGESIAFIGGAFGPPSLVWIGHGIVVAAVLGILKIRKLEPAIVFRG